MTDEQIKHMVNRFLGWKLPKTFRPDNYINFTPPAPLNPGTPYENDLWPIGTNLFCADQAEAMVRHMLEGMANPLADHRALVEALEDARRIIADIDDYMKRPGRGDWGEECACCMGELLDDDRETIARIDTTLAALKETDNG